MKIFKQYVNIITKRKRVSNTMLGHIKMKKEFGLPVPASINICIRIIIYCNFYGSVYNKLTIRNVTLTAVNLLNLNCFFSSCGFLLVNVVRFMCTICYTIYK
jgi:hypothetical protein